MPEPGEAVDMMMNADGGGWVLDRAGGIHEFGGAPKATGGPYWANQDVARRLQILDPSKPSGWVMDRDGAVHPFGGATVAPGGPYWPG